MRRPLLIAGAVALVAVVAIGIVQSGGGPGGGGGAPSNAQALRRLAGSPPALAAVHRDANRLLPGNGLQARLRALRGHPVVVNVWGSWCTPCRQEFGVFQRVSVALGRRVGFLGIDTQDSRENAGRFLAGHPVSYPSYLDFDGSIAKGLGLIGTPSTLFYDARGRTVQVHQGPYGSDADLRGDVRRYAHA